MRRFWIQISLLFAFAAGCFGQSCTVTSPTASQVVQSIAPLSLTLSLTSEPSAYKTDWHIDTNYVGTGFFTDTHPAIVAWEEQWLGTPFAIQWAPGLQGDGLKTATAYVFDVNGNLLTSCSQSFTVRVEGSSSGILSVPSSGKSTAMTMTTFNGSNQTGASFYLDGFNLNNSASPTYNLCGANSTTSYGSVGWQIPALNTECFPNGKHWAIGNTGAMYVTTFVETSTVSSVTGTTITTTAPHFVNAGSIVTFSNTGGSLPSPLVAGSQCYGQGSGLCTATAAVSGGKITITPSAATVATVGSSIYLRNMGQTNQSTGGPSCDGIFTAISPTNSTTITVSAPAGCLNTTTQEYNFELFVNPYCVTTGSGSSLSVSATFTTPTGSDNYPTCGSALSLSGGSGATTFTSRLHSRYWGGQDDFPNVGGNVAYIAQKVDIENGAVPMRTNPIYWEVPLVVGQTVNICNPATLIQNTDLSFTSTACNATGFGWNPVADGGISPASLVATVAVSASTVNVTGVGAGWMQISVPCAACAAGGVTLPTQTIYVHVFASAITFPTYSSCGPIASAFNVGLPSGCFSHYMRSLWEVGNPYYSAGETNTGPYIPLWVGNSLLNSNSNSIQFGLSTGTTLTDPTQTSCPTWGGSSSVPEMYWMEQWAAAYHQQIEFDMDTIWRANGANLTAVSTILNNIGYNRQACLQALASHAATSMLYWRFHWNDEYVTQVAGAIFRPNPTIGVGPLESIAVSGSTTTFTFTGISMQAQWSQSTGLGNWFQIIDAQNPCLDGLYPMNGVTNTGFQNAFVYSITSTNNGGCANGTYEPTGGITETTAQFILNPYTGSFAPSTGIQNTSALPGDLSQTKACWSGTGCQAIGPTITVSNCNISIPWTGNDLLAGATIRIWGATSANLNDVLTITSGAGVSPVTATYPNTTGQACPASGLYTSSTDPSLYITVDPYNPSITNGWGPNPFGQVYSLMTAVMNAPAHSFSSIGSFQGTSTIPSLVSYDGSPNATNSWLYNEQGGVNPIFAVDGTVGDWGTFWQSMGGLATRAYQVYPRSFLYSTTLGWQKYHIGYYFVPGLDKPTALLNRAESLIAQRAGMKFLGGSSDRNYDYDNNTGYDYSNRGLGWADPGTQSNGWINQASSPRQWHGGMALYNSYVALREDTDLQPEAPKLNLDRNFFLTDAHTSSTYGNSLSILCLSESPYGSQTVTLPQISGGSTLKYILTGTTLQVQVLAGNPTTDTDDFCAWPGTAGANAAPAPARITVYVSQPPGYTAVTNQTFSAPATLPYAAAGAVSMAIRVGYDPAELRHEPATACYPNCTLALDYHDVNLYVQRLYLNAANLPIDPNPPYQKLTSMGLP